MFPVRAPCRTQILRHHFGRINQRNICSCKLACVAWLAKELAFKRLLLTVLEGWEVYRQWTAAVVISFHGSVHHFTPHQMSDKSANKPFLCVPPSSLPTLALFHKHWLIHSYFSMTHYFVWKYQCDSWLLFLVWQLISASEFALPFRKHRLSLVKIVCVKSGLIIGAIRGCLPRGIASIGATWQH